MSHHLIMHLVHLKVQLDSLVHNIKNDLIHSIIDKIISNMLHPRHQINLSINQIREYLQLQERLRLNYDIVRHQIIHTGNLVALEIKTIEMIVDLIEKELIVAKMLNILSGIKDSG